MKKNYLILLLVLLLLPFVSAYSNSTGLVSEWTCDDTFNDNKGINNGTQVGTVSFSSNGKIGKSCTFTGSDSNYINVGSSDTLNPDEFTACAWVNQTSAGRKGIFVQSPSIDYYRAFSWSMGVANEYKQSLRVSYDGINNAYNETNTSISVNTLNFLCVSFSGTTHIVYMYKNGVNTDNSTSLGAAYTGIYNALGDAYIGRDQTASRAWNGTIDELTLWNRTLSTSEILTMYNDYNSGIRPSDSASVTNVTISSVSGTALSNTSALITWTTNIPTNVSTLKYGTTTSMTSSVTNTTYSTSHSQTLTGLTPSTLYYFNITGYNSTSLYNTSGGWNVTTQATPVPQSSYYFCPNGSDVTGNGTITNPYATITKLNTITKSPGNTFYFCRGGVWRLTTDAYPTFTSGSTAGNISYDAYGTGAKPVFLGSYNLSATTWTNIYGNIWVTTATYSLDIGNLIFNGNTNGYKYSSGTSLTSQGRFFKNETDDKIYLYSTSNPNTYYSSIEGAYKTLMFNIGNKDYIRISNLEFRYGGSHGISADGQLSPYNPFSYIYVTNNTFTWIGGSYQFPPPDYTRYGNCIEFGLSGNNVYIGYNNFSHCYDAAMSTQSWLTGGQSIVYNHVYEYNIVTYSSYGFEYFSSYSTSTARNISVDHNTFLHLGTNNFGTNSGRIRMDRTPVNSSNISFTNNIVYNVSYATMDFSDAGDWYGPFNTDYNLYYNSSSAGRFIQWNGTNYATLSAFLTATTGFEDHSIEANPSLASDYTPFGTSPVCGAGSGGSDIGAFACAYYDGVNPGVVANSPINTTSGTSPTLFNCSASDNDELYSINLYLNGVLNQTTYNSSNSTIVTWNINLPDGYYDWYCTAVDTSGNTNSTPENFVVVDIAEYNLTLITHEKITNNTLSGVTHYFGYGYDETKNKSFPYFNSSVNNTLVDTYGVASTWNLGLTTYFVNQSYVENMTASIMSDSGFCYSDYQMKMIFYYSDGTSQDTPVSYSVGCDDGSGTRPYTNYTLQNPNKNKVVVRAETYLNRGSRNVHMYQNYQRASYYEYFNLYNASNLLESTTYEVKSIKAGYYDLYNNITIVYSNETIHFYNMYNSTLNVFVINSYRNTTVNTFSGYIYNGTSFNESLNSTNGMVSLNLLTGLTYSLVIDSSSFALYSAEINLVNTTQSHTAYLYSNNSIYIEIRDESTGNLIPSGNTVTLNEDSTTTYSINSSYLFENLTSGTYSIVISNPGYQTRIYDVTVNERSTQNLTAYLLNSTYSTNYVVLTIIDANTGGMISNASIIMSRMINGAYRPVESKLSDISGQVQFNFQPLTKYQFSASATGYNSQVFYLNPIIFTSYNVRMDPEEVAIIPGQELTDVSVVYGGTTFYQASVNNFTFSISSGIGSLNDYNLTISYPGGIQTFSGVNALGDTFTAYLDMTGSVVQDFDTVNVTYCYDSTLGPEHCYSYTYDIIGYSSVGSWEENKDNTFGLGLLERLLIVTLAVIIVAGFFTIFAGPIAGGVIGLFLFGFFVATGFVEIWAILPSLLVGFFVLSKRGGL